MPHLSYTKLALEIEKLRLETKKLEIEALYVPLTFWLKYSIRFALSH
jgi:hypothetical protein